MKKHWHKGTSLKIKSFSTCVGMACNPDSHHGSTSIEICGCGQQRSINMNRSSYTGKEVKEFGTWHFLKQFKNRG